MKDRQPRILERQKMRQEPGRPQRARLRRGARGGVDGSHNRVMLEGRRASGKGQNRPIKSGRNDVGPLCNRRYQRHGGGPSYKATIPFDFSLPRGIQYVFSRGNSSRGELSFKKKIVPIPPCPLAHPKPVNAPFFLFPLFGPQAFPKSHALGPQEM